MSFEMPYGPHEVLFVKPTEPGVFTREVIENVQARYKAEREYQERHLEEYGERIQYVMPTGFRDYPFLPAGHAFRKVRRRPGSPSFETFFNSNLDRWY